MRKRQKKPICEDLPPTSLLPFPPILRGSEKIQQHCILSFLDSQQHPQPTCEYQAAVPQGPTPSTPHTPAYAAYSNTWSHLSTASVACGVPACPVPSTPAPKGDQLTVSALSSFIGAPREKSFFSSFAGTQQGKSTALSMEEVKPQDLGLSVSVSGHGNGPVPKMTSKRVVERFKHFVRRGFVRMACGSGNNQQKRVQHYEAM